MNTNHHNTNRKRGNFKINYIGRGGLTSGEGGGEMERGDKDLWRKENKNRLNTTK